MATCPKCGKYKPTKQEVLDHIAKSHSDDIPDDQTPAQYYYALHHGGRSYGLCRICLKPTKWNEKTGKPNQLCGDPACIAEAYKKASTNISSVHGEPHLAHREEHQAKMIANKKIASTYIWKNDKSLAKKTYVGSYELKLLEFLDTVLELPHTEVVTPGPVLEYVLDGQTKLWYTDVWLPEYNLIIEVKDGGDNKNNHPGFSENRRKEKAKDDMMRNQKKFNYLKHTDKNMAQLVSALAIIRFENLGNIKNENHRHPHIMINEAAGISNDIVNDLSFYLGISSKGLIFYSFSPTLASICYVSGNKFRWGSKEDLRKESVKLYTYMGDKDSIEKLYSFYSNTSDYIVDRQVHPSESTVFAEMIKMCDPLFSIADDKSPAEILTDMLATRFSWVADISNAEKYDYFEISQRLMGNKYADVANVMIESILAKHGIDYSPSSKILNESVSMSDARLEFDMKMENIMTGIERLKSQ